MGGALLAFSNYWAESLVLVQDLQNMCGGLVGKTGKFFTLFKYFHILSHMSNRFGNTHLDLYIFFLLVSNYYSCRPCLPKDKSNNNTMHYCLAENVAVGHWYLLFVIDMDHSTLLVQGY